MLSSSFHSTISHLENSSQSTPIFQSAIESILHTTKIFSMNDIQYVQLLVRFLVTHFPIAFADYGTIKKVLAPMNQTSSSCLLEEIELLPKNQREPIRSLQILHSQSVLFVGLQEHVIKVPLKRCPFYKTYRYEESTSLI